MKEKITEKLRQFFAGLLVGLAIGGVLEGIAALIGNSQSGVSGALLWARGAALVLGVISVWMLMRDISPSGRMQMIRADRTPQQQEYNAVQEYRAYEKTLREANGEEHRMPRRPGISLIALDFGLMLSALLPEAVAIFF